MKFVTKSANLVEVEGSLGTVFKVRKIIEEDGGIKFKIYTNDDNELVVNAKEANEIFKECLAFIDKNSWK